MDMHITLKFIIFALTRIQNYFMSITPDKLKIKITHNNEYKTRERLQMAQQ